MQGCRGAVPGGRGVTSPASRSWTDTATVEEWQRADRLPEVLQVPWQFAAGIIGTDPVGIRCVLDAGAGPGGFLDVLLRRFPAASGVWLDISPAMEAAARQRLNHASGRIQFHVAPLTALPVDDLAGSIDAVVSSRASHHLRPDELRAFYRGCAAVLRPGGWLCNLDHVSEDPEWQRRFRAALDEVRPRGSSGGHVHEHLPPSLGAHLDAATEAGFEDVRTAWQLGFTHLLVGRNRSNPGVPHQASATT